MNFDKWWEHNVGLTDTEGVHSVCQSAWEASKAEERERCAKIAEKAQQEHFVLRASYLLNSQPNSASYEDELVEQAREIAEQIRKGE